MLCVSGTILASCIATVVLTIVIYTAVRASRGNPPPADPSIMSDDPGGIAGSGMGGFKVKRAQDSLDTVTSMDASLFVFVGFAGIAAIWLLIRKLTLELRRDTQLSYSKSKYSQDRGRRRTDIEQGEWLSEKPTELE
ncbi:hypothetical protein JX265_006117 [Neoarthrinium moseri]|uniref:Uncharacterized protein n=1 Tax=Neoarthrinium moseri TaxID=1658444 RepID=A0A9P9WN97_9PEZI|nr:hypothetical protein JX265_006117 [Neoarthrinium moseri]